MEEILKKENDNPIGLLDFDDFYAKAEYLHEEYHLRMIVRNIEKTYKHDGLKDLGFIEDGVLIDPLKNSIKVILLYKNKEKTNHERWIFEIDMNEKSKNPVLTIYLQPNTKHLGLYIKIALFETKECLNSDFITKMIMTEVSRRYEI